MGKTMVYKNYSAKIDFSAEDEVFFGRIMGISDLITFEGTSVAELKRAFEEAVDDYLELCARHGREPEKGYKGSFNVRITPELHRKLALRADALDISLNQYVEMAIDKSLREQSGASDQ